MASASPTTPVVASTVEKPAAAIAAVAAAVELTEATKMSSYERGAEKSGSDDCRLKRNGGRPKGEEMMEVDGADDQNESSDVVMRGAGDDEVKMGDAHDGASAEAEAKAAADDDPWDPNYLERLSEPLRSTVLAAVSVAQKPEGGGDVGDTSKPSSDAAMRSELLEIALRRQVQKLLRVVNAVPADSSTDTDTLHALGEFWRGSLRACFHISYHASGSSLATSSSSPAKSVGSSTTNSASYVGLNVRKLPVLLLEDCLDGLTVEGGQRFWKSHVEPSGDVLFSEELWNPGPKQHPCWLPFLKASNKFLKRLQQHRQQSSSATAVCAGDVSDGKGNALSSWSDVASTESSSSWAGRIMVTLAREYPLGEKSATKAWGSHNTDNVTGFETESEFDQERASSAIASATQQHTSSLSLEERNQDYNFYQSFWSLQKDFNNPNAITVADFLKRLRVLLQALESHGQDPPAAAAAATTTKPGQDATSLSEAAAGKYMTSSRLLAIQLSDPAFCATVLTQFLITAHHLTEQVPVLESKLKELLSRARSLLLRNRPGLLRATDAVLSSSEQQWRDWKKKKGVPELDTPAVADRSAEGYPPKRHDGEEDKKLPATTDGEPKEKGKFKEEEDEVAYQPLSITGDLRDVSQKMRSIVPETDPYLRDYAEALDPESGIEPQYHPGNNKTFCWRALRLLAGGEPGVSGFHLVRPTGDLELIVRHYYKRELNVDIPGGEDNEATEENWMEYEDEEEEQEKKREDTEEEAKPGDSDKHSQDGDDGDKDSNANVGVGSSGQKKRKRGEEDADGGTAARARRVKEEEEESASASASATPGSYEDPEPRRRNPQEEPSHAPRGGSQDWPPPRAGRPTKREYNDRPFKKEYEKEDEEGEEGEEGEATEDDRDREEEAEMDRSNRGTDPREGPKGTPGKYLASGRRRSGGRSRGSSPGTTYQGPRRSWGAEDGKEVAPTGTAANGQGPLTEQQSAATAATARKGAPSPSSHRQQQQQEEGRKPFGVARSAPAAGATEASGGSRYDNGPGGGRRGRDVAGSKHEARGGVAVASGPGRGGSQEMNATLSQEHRERERERDDRPLQQPLSQPRSVRRGGLGGVPLTQHRGSSDHQYQNRRSDRDDRRGGTGDRRDDGRNDGPPRVTYRRGGGGGGGGGGGRREHRSYRR